jgi:toxin ParE1/3/4
MKRLKIPSHNGVYRLEVRWTKRALSQFSEAENYIAKDNPQAANAVAKRIFEATLLLANNPKMGRVGRIHNTREWSVKDTPYLIAYAIDGDLLIILRVLHSKQRWPQRI